MSSFTASGTLFATSLRFDFFGSIVVFAAVSTVLSAAFFTAAFRAFVFAVLPSPLPRVVAKPGASAVSSLCSGTDTSDNLTASVRLVLARVTLFGGDDSTGAVAGAIRAILPLLVFSFGLSFRFPFLLLSRICFVEEEVVK